MLEAQPAAQRLRRDFTNEFRERLLAELAVHPGTYLITKAQRHKMVNEDGYFLITLGPVAHFLDFDSRAGEFYIDAI